MLSNEEICSRVEAAFSPYRCVAEVWDYDNKLRFRVFNSADVPLATMGEVVLSSVREARALESLLASVWLHIEDRAKQRGLT